jgi:pimeloyl-ACP methyl ester carboxylesterase
MNRVLAGGLLLAASALAVPAEAQTAKPTVVLVHGAFADSSSWNGVIAILERDGYNVVAAPNPLRGVRAYADVVSDIRRASRVRSCWSVIAMAAR